MFLPGRRRGNKGNAIAEFGPAIWIFFVIIIIPLIDLASFMWGVGTCMMVANLSVRKATGARTYTEAIALVNSTEDDLANFRSFALISPSNNATRGVALNVLGYKSAGGNVTTYTPPPVAGRIPVDRATLDSTVYHYQVVAAYDVQPIFNFNSLPVFSGVPGLGQPVPVVYSGTAVVEHPEGLND